MTDQTQEESTSTPAETQVLPSNRSIEIIVPSDGTPIGLNINGTFKTYEFYGVFVSILIDVFTSNFMSEFKRSVVPPDQASLAKAKEQIAKVLRESGLA